MTCLIDSLANNKTGQGPGGFDEKDPPFEYYQEPDWESLQTAEEAEGITYEECDEGYAYECMLNTAESACSLVDPDKLEEDITDFITCYARYKWLCECYYSNGRIPQHVLREVALWDRNIVRSRIHDLPKAYNDGVRNRWDSSPWCEAIYFYAFREERRIRIDNYRLAWGIRPRVKPHPPFSQWYEEALAYPLPDEHPDVFKKYYRRMYEEYRSRVEEQLEGNELLGEYVLQTAPNPAFCPGIKPQVAIRARTGALLTPQLASQAPQFEDADRNELLTSLNEVCPGRKPDPLIKKRKEIVRQLMSTPIDFQNPKKVKTLFDRLDAEQIPLSKWRRAGRMWQLQTWKELLEKPRSPEYQRRIGLLKRDLYPQRQG